jgi:very-short-patch-repair endonuclease
MKEDARMQARKSAEKVLDSLKNLLVTSGWYSPGWLDEVLAGTYRNFDSACERWRGLYLSAHKQAKRQNDIILDASKSIDDKNQAKRLRQEAETQMTLLADTDINKVFQSDFYSYRYFASEGFLPGYNFPRLPLSAYIPGRRNARGRDEYLSRPRFLAISEFGPRSFIYHEGSRYIINKVILPVSDEEVNMTLVKQCPVCGYVHFGVEGEKKDCCDVCGYILAISDTLKPLFRLQNVSAKRRDKISSDEEERLRMGYELKTGIRFAQHGENPTYKVATVITNSETIATLTYGQAATIWRINLGWTRRINKNQYGFVLDTERGYWSRNEQIEEDNDSDQMSNSSQRVIPYVMDTRNCLLFKPTQGLQPNVMASLQSALKNAIQLEYQLEDNELAAEPLPSADIRNQVLFYEAAEGGAGVLKNLIEDPQALSRVARCALELCHYNPETGDDYGHASGASENCEAACYDCLMSYGNQRDHKLLDRKAIKDLLQKYVQTIVKASPVECSRAEHLEQLKRLCDSSLEIRWLEIVETCNFRLPSYAQHLITTCHTKPDFYYANSHTAIYIDGPIHQYPDRQKRDDNQTETMEDQGFTVIRFKSNDNWEAIFKKYPNIFGSKQ